MNIPIWPGSSSFFPGDTPFGFYDYDYDFQQDADKVALFCSRGLGYPLVDVELQDINFYAAFEMAITTYGNEIYAYRVRQDYLTLEGSSNSVVLNNSLITPNLGTIIRVSEQYGAEAGVGGNIENYTGSIDLTAGTQVYDLKSWAVTNNILSGDLEIKRVFYQAPPAIVRYFDPYAGSGVGMMSFIDSFGWGSYSPAINFMLMPLNYDIQKLQTMEMHDTIRKSNYSFELINNKLRIFPIPKINGKLFFEYIKKSERLANSVNTSASGSITDVSNALYTNPEYSRINSIGRSWVFEYTLALCKEMLGYIRGKYTTIPIPDAAVTLNQADLLAAATSEKNALIEKLRTYLADMSREKLMERRSLETEYRQKELQQIPYLIYVG